MELFVSLQRPSPWALIFDFSTNLASSWPPTYAQNRPTIVARALHDLSQIAPCFYSLECNALIDCRWLLDHNIYQKNITTTQQQNIKKVDFAFARPMNSRTRLCCVEYKQQTKPNPNPSENTSQINAPHYIFFRTNLAVCW